MESQNRKLSTELLRRLLGDGLAVEIQVTGSSMAPALRGGDVVTLVPVARSTPRVGDVVAFLRRGHSLVVHRLVERRGSLCRARGDAAPAADEPISESEILGRVTRITRDARPVRFGLGPERRLLAWLSRRGWLRRALVGGARLRALHRGGLEA